MVLPSERPHAVGLALLLGLLATGLPACRTPVAAPVPEDRFVNLCSAPRETVSLEYLGSGGVLVKVGADALMTAPFFSNPGLARVALGLPISPVRERIPAAPRTDLAGTETRAILVGHSHYDHLMDVPSVVDKWGLRSPRLYGSRTTSLMLERIAGGLRAVVVDDAAGDWERPGRWLSIPGSRLRIMALRSEHAPHMMGVKLFGGELEEVPRRAPRNAYDWPEGQTYAWIVDVLAEGGGAPILRFYYQDAATNAPIGFVPREILDERSVDVAVLCAASFEEVDDHPTAIVEALAPRFVLAAHWENFFQEQGEPGKAPRPVPFLDMREFRRRLEAALPAPDQSYHVPIRGDVFRFGVCAGDEGPDRG